MKLTKTHLGVPGSRESNEFWSTFSKLANALSDCQHVLPAFDDSRGVQPFETVGPLNPLLAPAHYGIQACTMLLFNCIHEDPQAYQTVLTAAHGLVNLARRIRASGTLPPIYGIAFLIVSILFLFDSFSDTTPCYHD